MKMNPTIKAIWVKALLSGKYRQARGWLERVDKSRHRSHCCLGVLCDLYIKETGHNIRESRHDLFGAFNYNSFNSNQETLPGFVQEWAGLKSDDPVVLYTKNDDPITLATLNDGEACIGIKKYSFKEIAEVIQKHL